MMVSSTDAVYKVKAKLQWPSVKPQYLLLGVSVGLIVLAIILKAMLGKSILTVI
jgi:hypothetical protein